MTNASHCPECTRLREELLLKDEEVKRLQERLDEMTLYDEQTGVLNRKGVLDIVERELMRSKRTGHPFCLAVINLDGFSHINDAHGHQIGDKVLHRVSLRAVKQLRAIDRFGRLDGDSFIVVLPTNWPDQGVIAIRRLREAIESIDWADLVPEVSVTFSAGLTPNATNDTLDAILGRAEKALAQARAEGGARTVLIEEELPDMPNLDDI